MPLFYYLFSLSLKSCLLILLECLSFCIQLLLINSCTYIHKGPKKGKNACGKILSKSPLKTEKTLTYSCCVWIRNFHVLYKKNVPIMIKDDEEGHLRVLKLNWVFVKEGNLKREKCEVMCVVTEKVEIWERYMWNRCLIALLRDDFGVFSSKYPWNYFLIVT